MSDKKYYWLKLHKDFFKRHDIKIIEAMPNGKDYLLFYLKLLVESIDHDGMLRFSDTIPYNEEMLSVIANTNVDVVRSAMKVFTELRMIDVLDDQTIFMAESQRMLGCETKWAEKKRKYREKEDNVLALSNGCPDDVRQEKEKEIELEIDKENTPKPPKGDKRFDRFWTAYPKKVGKGAAQKAFAKVKTPVDILIAAIETQKLSEQWQKSNGQFIPNPATWLNQGRWEDEVSTAECAGFTYNDSYEEGESL